MLIKKHRFDKQVFMEDIKLDLVAAAVSISPSELNYLCTHADNPGRVHRYRKLTRNTSVHPANIQISFLFFALGVSLPSPLCMFNTNQLGSTSRWSIQQLTGRSLRNDSSRNGYPKPPREPVLPLIWNELIHRPTTTFHAPLVSRWLPMPSVSGLPLLNATNSRLTRQCSTDSPDPSSTPRSH
jgi:hypothetical protein